MAPTSDTKTRRSRLQHSRRKQQKQQQSKYCNCRGVTILLFLIVFALAMTALFPVLVLFVVLPSHPDHNALLHSQQNNHYSVTKMLLDTFHLPLVGSSSDGGSSNGGPFVDHLPQISKRRSWIHGDGDGDGDGERMKMNEEDLDEELGLKEEGRDPQKVGITALDEKHNVRAKRAMRSNGSEEEEGGKRTNADGNEQDVRGQSNGFGGDGGVRDGGGNTFPPPPRPARPETLARGVSGLPISATPSLMDAKRGNIKCDVDVDFLAYWNDPQGYLDQEYQSPFAFNANESEGKNVKYLTFEPDRGGWNNIRMSMEIVIVIARATGRTLVLPPDQPLYRLYADKKHKQRGFANFFPLHSLEFSRHISIISMKDFLNKEGLEQNGGRFLIDDEMREAVLNASDKCEHRKKSKIFCDPVYDHLRSVGHVPDWESGKHCLIFDRDVFHGSAQTDEEKAQRIKAFCGDREAKYYDDAISNVPLLHIASSMKGRRLLNHFYAFVLFTDPAVNNYFKRFVRDFLHYKDEIFCAAGKIIRAIQEEGRMKRANRLSNGDAAATSSLSSSSIPYDLDEEGAGEYSSLHVRRGEFQYKRVKISAHEWYQNTRDLFEPGQILFIATDEKDKTFFGPLADNYEVKFLDDYWDMAGLEHLDPNYLGMIDTIVASRGKVFVGTYFSTFTGYINRMRGYHGMPMKCSYYGTPNHKTVLHEWKEPGGAYYSREFPTGWVGIDGDGIVTKERHSLSSSPPKHDKEIEQEPAKSGVTVEADPDRATLGPGRDEESSQDSLPLARGVSGLPIEETPALVGAKRGHIECDVNVDSLVYWNDPQGKRDVEFESPFATPSSTSSSETKYITFEPDSGGWNNIRMSMEIIIVIAAATGRTLVLPPDQPLYRLMNDKSKKQRGFADFFPIHTAKFQNKVKVISSKEFLRREGGSDGRLPIPENEREAVLHVQEHCERRAKSKIFCGVLFRHYKNVGLDPNITEKNCLVFDENVMQGQAIAHERGERVKEICGKRREPIYYDSKLKDAVTLHFPTSEKGRRLVVHYYNFIIFTNPKIDNYYKRFVRDFLHYHDAIFCAAGKIVNALQEMGKSRIGGADAEIIDKGEGEEVVEEDHDNNGAGRHFATMHVRRGDLQYKEVKIPANELYDNLQDIWKPNELIYIATDEHNATFFDPIKQNHEIKFLNDFVEIANLHDVDPNYFGMIDTIVASQGRVFAGTYYSTFTGYINRMRGYHGISMKQSFYGTKQHLLSTHTWKGYGRLAFAKEFPDGWIGIDGDEIPSREMF